MHKSALFISVLLVLAGCQQSTKSVSPAAEVFSLVQPDDRSHLSVIMDTAAAIHLERRVGIGSPKYRVDRLIGKTRAEAIEIIIGDLASDRRISGDLPAWLSDPSITFLDNSWRYCRRLSSQVRIGDVETRWMNNILTSDAPAHERLVLLFSNIFVSDYKTYQSAETYAQHHQIIREHSVGNMRDFLAAVLQDPAILVYLNNDLNTRANINENLAREYLELFTLGEGNYTERDIRNLAYVFAGESVNPISQKYQRFRSAKSSLNRMVLGREIKSPLEAVELVLQQPAHARLMAKKFYREYISLNAPSEETVEKIASRYFKSNFEITELLRGTLSTSDFWAEENRLGLIKDPVDIILGSFRTLGYENTSEYDTRDFSALFSRMNYSLIDPPNVAGYEGGLAWVDGGLFNTRKEVLSRLLLNDDFDFDFEKKRHLFWGFQADERKRLEKYRRKLHRIKAQAHPEQLIVEAAVFRSVSNDMKKRRHPKMTLNLVGVHLGEKSWDGMTIRIGMNKKSNYANVSVFENSCSPACISNFNKGYDSDSRGVRGFEVSPFEGGGPKSSLKERWASISEQDRLLLRRLFQMVHLLPDSVGNGRLFHRGGAENTRAWMDWLASQRSKAPFDDLRDEYGKVLPPVILLRQDQKQGGLCGNVLSSEAHSSWSRPIGGIPQELSARVNRTDDWITAQLPAGLLGSGANALERLVLSDSFQLK